MSQRTIGYQAKSILKLIALPLVVFAIMHIVDTAVAGRGVVSSSTDLRTLFRNVITSFCFAMALNCNLLLGRMDLSAGAQMYMGCIFGGNIAIRFNLGGVGVLVLSIFIGGLCGLLVGILFVNLRILPMVLGIGMTLIFETFSFASYNQQGLMLYGKKGVGILSDMGFITVVTAILILVLTFIFQYSTFGYKRRAIQGSQKLAGDAGINIFKNCILCYLIAGTLVACAGIFDTAYKGTMTPVLGMSSNGSVFSNMFPLFVGIWIGAFVNNPVLGVLMGSLSVKILTLGLSKLPLQGSTQNIIIYSLFLLFTIYRMNAHKVQYYKKRKERVRLAHKTRQELEISTT